MANQIEVQYKTYLIRCERGRRPSKQPVFICFPVVNPLVGPIKSGQEGKSSGGVGDGQVCKIFLLVKK